MSDFNTTISFDVFNVSLSFVDEGTFIVVKQYVDEQLDSKQDDISDLLANKADKETTYTKSEVEQIKLELLDLIYAGL